MTFPATPLPIGVEAYLGSAWEDITSYVYTRDGITISRGRTDEGTVSEPSKMRLTLNNRDGRFSPRNPTGPYWGQLGPNTPIRTWIRNGQVRLRLAGADQFYTTDKAAISVTGDLDLRLEIDLPSWRPAANTILGPVKGTDYYIQLTPYGILRLWWTDAGAATHSLVAAQPVPGGLVGRKAIRVTLDVNYLGTHALARFWTSDSITGTWTDYGGGVTEVGTTSIRDSGSALGIYCATEAQIYAAQVRDGIAGTIVAYPIFTAQTSGTTSFSDGYGNTWTTSGTALVDDKHYRFTGSMTTLPQRWDVSGNDVYVPVECSGVTRRLNQGNNPVDSVLTNSLPNIGAGLVAYWPMEDAEGSTTLAPKVGNRLMVIGGTPALAAFTGFKASKPVPTLTDGEPTRLVGPVTAYTNTDEAQIRFLCQIPTSPASGRLMRVHTSSTLGWIDLSWDAGSQGLKAETYTNLGVLSTTLGPVSLISGGMTGKTFRCSLELQKNGTGVDVAIVVLEVGASTGLLTSTTNAGITLGTITQVTFFGAQSSVSWAVGHCTIEKTITSIFDYATQLNAYAGEAAGNRILRLATEAGITADVRGYSYDTELMGYQLQGTTLGLIRECAATDAGILFESRTADEIAYRPVTSLYAQDARWSIPYSDHGLAEFEPTDDDQRTRNRITVSRIGGTSTTVEDSTSPMGTLAPGSGGVGVYADSVSLSLHVDDATANQAGWRLALGTVNEARWPRIGVNLAHPDYTGNARLTQEILETDVGDLITVTGLPAWLPPDDVRQIVQGTTERISQFEHTITFNCEPASPYGTGTWEADGARWSNENTTLAGTMTTTSTSRTVTIAAGPMWTTTGVPFDVMVGGEQMTVTAVAGASSPQTFTVTRSVNGVVKAHASGEAVTLYTPTRYSL